MGSLANGFPVQKNRQGGVATTASKNVSRQEFSDLYDKTTACNLES
jgi:hypothetical protein